MNTDIKAGPFNIKSSERGTAIFSQDGLYRYRLTRRWEPGGKILGTIGQNPSTADHETDDMTIAKEIGFAKRLGCSALAKSNLGAFITSDPQSLLVVQDPIGRHNDGMLVMLAQEADILVACWGAMDNRIWALFKRSLELIKRFNNVKCLGLTKSGAPKHTSRLGYDAPLIDWRKA